MTLIGEGTYGSVWLARAPNGTRVALKKIRKEKKEGFPITAIREIKILKALRHPNIVQLRDVVSSHLPGREGDVFLAFEYCDHDLTGLLESKVHLSDAVIKYYLKSILEGLYYLHQRQILHRDIKGANILISNNGDVRIADFGLARSVAKGRSPCGQFVHASSCIFNQFSPSPTCLVLLSTSPGGYTNRVVTLWYRAPEVCCAASELLLAVFQVI